MGRDEKDNDERERGQKGTMKDSGRNRIKEGKMAGRREEWEGDEKNNDERERGQKGTVKNSGGDKNEEGTWVEWEQEAKKRMGRRLGG